MKEHSENVLVPKTHNKKEKTTTEVCNSSDSQHVKKNQVCILSL
jgi:hypothetical protein